jgi:hypothetical protein
MAEKVLNFTKLTFIIHSIIGLLFTILFFIPDFSIPLFFGSISLATEATHAMALTLGSIFLGLTVSSIISVVAKEWKQIKIVVILEIVWLIAGLVTTIVSFVTFDVVMGALVLVFEIILLALFCLTFLQQEDTIKPIF